MGYYNDVLVEFHYGGHFKQDSITKKTVYVEGDKCCEVMDKDKTSFIDLLDFSASLAKATKDCITMHYKIPDVDVGESLGSISSDNELIEMFAVTNGVEPILIYICTLISSSGSTGLHLVDVVPTSINPEAGQSNRKGPKYLDLHLFDYESGSDYQLLQSSSESECYEDSPQYDDESDHKSPKMEVGLQFVHVEQFRLALRQYCVANSFECNFVKNEKKRVTATCAIDGCPWRIHASIKQDGKTFQIKTFVDVHKCNSINSRGNTMATATWIADQVESRLRDEPECKVSFLMSDLFKKYGLNVKYHKAWRGKEIALERIFGSYEYSYSMVPALCFEILRTNQGSIAKYSLEGQHQFYRLFISFAACRFAFLSGCRPFIGLDGCHLKGKYKGTMLSAIALDGNNGIIPVAFAVVEAETKDSWFTFLEQLRDSINSDHVTFMSDRQKGLTESVQAVFPEAHHRFCVRHMYKNFQKEHKGLLLRNIFWRAARAYTIYEFNKEMEKLKELSPQARAWCDAVPPYQWSRAYFNEDVKCKEITNNFSESWNNFIASARAQPICDLVDVIRRKLMVKFHDRRKESNAWENVIVKKVDDEMKEIELKSRGCALLFAGSDEYEVNADDGRHTVFLHRHSCTCRQWQVSGIPCKHAVACILNRRERPEAYCAPCYKTTTLQAAYIHVLHPIPHKEQWNKPEVYDVYPPSNRRPPGRPRRNRRRDVDEEPSTGRQPIRKQKVTCALCKQLGHNKRTCKNTVVSGSKRSRPNDTI